MKISTKGRYGLRAMIDLALFSQVRPVPIKDIANRQKISDLYLEQIFAILKKNNLVKSKRGMRGGYYLERNPGEIKVSEIINAMEGPIEVVSCLKVVADCEKHASCPTQFLWRRINQSVERVLDAYTLEDMMVEAKYKDSNLL